MRACIMTGMDWHEYVKQVVGNDRQTEVARKTGIDQTTISRWLRPEQGGTARISSQSVAKFARGYGKSVLQAFVVAGFLTPEEAGMQAEAPVDVSSIGDDALMQEVQRRLGGRGA